MSTLPKGWENATLEDISKVVRGITFPASAKEFEHAEHNVCCLRTSNIQREVEWGDIYFVPKTYVKRPEQLVQSGDVLMSMANSYELVGKVAVAKSIPYPTAFGAFLSAIRPTSIVDGKYLFHLLRTYQVQSELRKGSSQTTNIANISVGTLSSIEIPLAPLAEQKRIADKLDSVLARVDACRERLARVQPLLKRFRQSVLAAATSGRLTEDWRAERAPDYKSGAQVSVGDLVDQAANGQRASTPSATSVTGIEPASVYSDFRFSSDEVDLFDSPRGWASTKIGDVTSDLRYGTSKKCDYQPEGTAVLRIPNIGDGRAIDLNDLKYANFDAKELAKLSLHCGDILVIRSNGSVDLVGKCAVVRNESEGLLFAGYLMRLRVSTDRANPDYVALSIGSPQTRKVIELTAKSTSGVNNINSEELRNLPLFLPPFEEQHEIVHRVETLFAFADRLEARLAAVQSAADKLTPALLAKAFRGELVPQDPNDEPAAELLKRLAAQRAAAPKPKRGRKAASAGD
ncbi:restriction endonuclease subunit S [Chromobacterium violaceum]|uniref:restriction endonuclease subunit S n=1 Tax=Chromobacterium violaceum TaxID=536 RepID=UPI0009BA0731|nr:restriction endonuclease subunit S [Chromobacterium violaceum]